MFKKAAVAVITALTLTAPIQTQAEYKCSGEFPNLMTDICWSCMFPIRIAGQSVTNWIGSAKNQEDVRAPTTGVCECFKEGRGVGLMMEYWEPSRWIESVYEPYCLPMLGGQVLPIEFRAHIAGSLENVMSPNTTSHAQPVKGVSGFRTMNYYISPLIFIMQVMMDTPCMEIKGFDLAYMSNLDPTWENEDLAAVIAPHAYAFSSIPVLNGCFLDCMAASTGFPISELFWCAGCNGTQYPQTGFNPAENSNEQTGRLLAQRLLGKFHALGVATTTHTKSSWCGKEAWMPLLDKRAYKMSRIHYIPQRKAFGRCCNPLGHPTDFIELGSEVPILGKDLGYQLFRKRACCVARSLTDADSEAAIKNAQPDQAAVEAKANETIAGAAGKPVHEVCAGADCPNVMPK